MGTFRPSDHFWELARQLESVRRIYQSNFLGNWDFGWINQYSLVDKYQMALGQLTGHSWNDLQQTLGLSSTFATALEAAHLRVKTLSGLEASLNDLHRVLPQISLWADRHFSQFREVDQLLRTRPGMLDALTVTPTQLFAETVASMEAIVSSVAVPDYLLSTITVFPNSYLRFVRDQVWRVARAEEESPERAHVATKVLEYSRGISLEQTALTTAMLESSPTDDTPVDSNRPLKCNVLRVLNQHASPMYAGLQEIEDDTLSSLLPEQIRQTSIALAKLVLQLKELGLSNGRELFHLTTRCFDALLDLTYVIAGDRIQFGHVVGQLYMIFHEATEKSRTLRGAGVTHLEALVDVQRLRHYFCHDFENNPHRGGVSQLSETSEIFMRLIGKKRPILPMDWKRAQLAVYIELVTMLEAIRDYIVTS